ncbi:MAG: SWIM zinc finger family protein [Deltaproteobacteria bacterium]|nr:SWIM zinc finger family protein [Deltaproteobacteria bacterium]
MSSWYYRDYYTPSVPHRVKGGIKAQTKRGSFGQSWWAKRWIAVLESFNIGARLGRGRSYARSGQVVSIDIGKGLVTAEVQGSRKTPYSVKINVKTLSESEWKKIARALSGQAFFIAKLLAGEMPENIEDVFKAVKLTLFPDKLKDLTTNCSCPDWSNPCKHIAAVYYLLGEEFDRDPFLIFKLRGMDRDQLLSIMDVSSVPNKTDLTMPEPVQEPEQDTQLPPEPLTSDPMSFWGQAKTNDVVSAEVSVPTVAGALAKRLGGFPLWRGQQNFLEFLEKVYAKASPVGLEIFLGETGTDASLK